VRERRDWDQPAAVEGGGDAGRHVMDGLRQGVRGDVGVSQGTLEEHSRGGVIEALSSAADDGF